MDRFTSMEVFARVAEVKGFSEAARRLGQSKSSVSKHVSALENHLGVRLLNRTTRRLSLTEAGVAYYDWCRRIAADMEAAEESVTRLHAEPRGNLKVNAPMSFGWQHLAPAIPGFLDRYPHVTVEMSLDDRFVDLIEEGFDLAVRITRLADSSLIARRIASARRIICASPDYLAEHGVPRTPADLVQHNCLIYSYSPRGDRWRFSGPDGEYTVRVSGNFWANNGDALRTAALAGLGVLPSPSFIVGEDLRAGRLKAVLGDFRTPDLPIHAVYPHQRHMTAKLRVFIDYMIERFATSPSWDAI
jgi:DNA-binding transcriptional LysR family regulator